MAEVGCTSCMEYRSVLERIARLDYRGNRHESASIAEEALSESKSDYKRRKEILEHNSDSGEILVEFAHVVQVQDANPSINSHAGNE